MKKYILNLISIAIIVIFLIVFIITFRNILKTEKSTVDSLQTTEFSTHSNNPETEISEETSEETSVQDISQKTFVNAPKGYFDDALFIGDSRTVGLSEYSSLKSATFFSTPGMSVYNIDKEKTSTPGVGKMTLDSILSHKKYGKIYVMLGINELGYNQEATVNKYEKLIETIKSSQPYAIIFIEANLHVAEKRSSSDKVFNNKNINNFNSKISKFADNKTVFYIDVNTIFDDENGNLDAKYTSDNSHVLGKYYKTWGEWLATVAVVK